VFELILFLAAGLLLAALFLFWVLGQWGAEFELPPAHVARLTELVPLTGVSYQRAERLFDARDYRFLAAQPPLAKAARQLEQDRRQIALQWLQLVREDYARLLRFRRILVACGAPTDTRTEWRLLRERLAFLVLYGVLTLWIRLFGLYAAPRAHTALLNSLGLISTLLARMLTRLSHTQLAEVKQLWAPAQTSTTNT